MKYFNLTALLACLTVPVCEAAAVSCSDAATPISSIQGTAKSSPMVGQQVAVEALVSAVTPKLGGYFLLEQSKDWDDTSKSSEGIFVHDQQNFPKVGDAIFLKGTVEELKDLTQIGQVTSLAVCSSNNPLVATSIKLPFKQAEQLESIEGMLVDFPQSLTISENYNFVRYGQLLLSNGRLFQPTSIAEPGEAAKKVSQANKLNQLLLDDNSNEKNPTVDFDSTHPYRTGNTVEHVRGVIYYSYGNYLLEPTVKPIFTRTNLRKPKPEFKVKGDLRVASFNVLNYFNGNGAEKAFPTERGAHSKPEFERQNAKTVAAMKTIGADIFGLMELENDGFDEHSAIAELTRNLAKASGTKYAFINAGKEKFGSDSITVGMIYNADKVEPVGHLATLNQLPFDHKSRLPMAQAFRQKSTGRVFNLVVNHFKSKGSCPASHMEKTNMPDPNADQHDDQGCWNASRVEAAKALINWLATDPTGSGDKDILIIGDLNANAKEDPVTTIVEGGFVNLVERYQGNKAYSFVYRGLAGYLDHALASATMASQVVETLDWHINADEMSITDYNLEGKTEAQQKSLYKSDPFRSSDHDPMIIELKLKM